MVSFDVRDVYLKDVALLGWTAWDEPVFPNLIGYIEKRSDQATGGQVLALKDNAQAQQEFMERRHIGNFVLLPLGG